MSKQVLSLSYRPKTLDAMVGMEKLAEKIRGHAEESVGIAVVRDRAITEKA